MEHYKYLEQLLRLSFNAKTQESIEKYATTRQFPMGTTVLPEGETSNSMYLIMHGMVRGYYMSADGNDVTKCFSVENELFGTECFRTGRPATFSIECLEDCECIELPYPLVRSAMQTDEEIGTYMERLFEREVNRLEQRNKSILLLSAEERYLEFSREYPKLHRRLPLKTISSYLGIRPETLSRIRSKWNAAN